MEMTDPSWTVRMHDRPLLKAHKQLPRPKDLLAGTDSLRSRYLAPVRRSNSSLRDAVSASHNPAPATSVLPLTPPTPPTRHSGSADARYDDSSTAETTILRSRIVTPTHQRSPPTPDITPPRFESSLMVRPFLGSQPSMISTGAESFRTAREELSSDDDLDKSVSPSQYQSRQKWPVRTEPLMAGEVALHPSPLALYGDTNPPQTVQYHQTQFPNFGTLDGTSDGAELAGDRRAAVGSASKTGSSTKHLVNGVRSATPQEPVSEDARVEHSPLRPPPQSPDTEDSALAISTPSPRGRSLRERLEESRRVESRPSTEKFARDIGWSHKMRSPEMKEQIQSWRLSDLSTTSTIEAIVVDTIPMRQQTLRHSRKHDSLRSASSPIPQSNRSSLLSNPDSPHRLVHKRGKLNNTNRWSVGSEVSGTLSFSSSNAGQPKTEVIRVAVIPERKSSLKSSSHSSNRHSLSQSVSSEERRSSLADHKSPDSDIETPFRKYRTISDSIPAGPSFAERGRDGLYAPPSIPARSSSLSASTTRSHSRANSITSEHLRVRRQAAEDDLRQTLERMDSKLKAARVKSQPLQVDPTVLQADPEVELWENLRPPSTHHTLLSQPSILSASPGPVEMGQARAVNLFPHNNHSLQLIEQHPVQESRAVQELLTSLQDLQLHNMPESSTMQNTPRKSSQDLHAPSILTSCNLQELQKPSQDLQVLKDEPTIPLASERSEMVVESPLRNPRAPPQPPKFKVILPTPGVVTPVEGAHQPLGLPRESKGTIGRRFASLNIKRGASLQRPSLQNRRYSESFMRSISRSLSFRNPQNRKADQKLEGDLHPFWRPRGFWDDFSDSDEDGAYPENDIIVQNSLGMPQRRIIFDGPLSLARKISDKSRQRRHDGKVSKRTSHGSLSRTRAGKNGRKVRGLKLHLQLGGLRGVQQRMLVARQGREDTKRETRREELRKSIGPNLAVRGDSRFPPETTGSLESTALLPEKQRRPTSSRSAVATGDEWMMNWISSSR